MTDAQMDEATGRQPLRLWPGVALVVVQWLLWLGLPIIMPEQFVTAVIGGVILGLGVALWWLFFSRAPWPERLGAIALMVVVLYLTRYILHESIANAGQGMLMFIYAIPVLSLALVVWAVASQRLASGPRRAALVATVLLACSGWALLRTEGTSSAGSQFKWRWTPTPEERLLAQAENEPTTATADLDAGGSEASGPEWPGFRGPRRDGIVPGIRIATDWSASPPVELWRRPVGPGWSSFAVHGDLIYTQEQRGEEEIVSCYRASTGEPVWKHRDTARFWESNGGAGPRATPTLSGGRVYTFGATGILNVLDAGDGTVVWSRDVVADTEIEAPYWGFSSSPLLSGDIVIIAVSGTLAAYDLVTGEPRWQGPDGGGSYSSPHLLTLDGVEQVVLLSGAGATGVAPSDGKQLWLHEWPGFGIVQPALTADGDLLIGADQIGTTRLTVKQAAGGWSVEERWTSNRLKSNFNDFVIHEGHAYGFDGTILACLDVEAGERQWKGGRYGQGQLVLLPDQDLLLVITEKGELALVQATPEKFTEIARVPAIEGKTWNHPVLAGDLLLVRNDREMAAFRVSVSSV